MHSFVLIYNINSNKRQSAFCTNSKGKKYFCKGLYCTNNQGIKGQLRTIMDLETDKQVEKLCKTSRFTGTCSIKIAAIRVFKEKPRLLLRKLYSETGFCLSKVTLGR